LFARLNLPGVDYKGLHHIEPKLLFVRIASHLRGYLDTSGLLCLNALNVIRKRPQSSLDLRCVLAILNSRLLRAMVHYEITAGASLTIRFSNAAMKALPLPALDPASPTDRQSHDQLVALAEEMLQLHDPERQALGSAEQQSRIATLDDAIDGIVDRLYGLSKSESALLEAIARGQDT
jgi:hypothetical protein